MRAVALTTLTVCSLAVAAPAPAAPGTGPHETLDQTFTTTAPDSPSGFTFHGVYHAAGDPNGNPPYMRRMTFYPPAGLRYDTSVAPRCTKPDLVLALRGAAACPGSRLGGGTTTTSFLGRFPSTVDIDLLNGDGEQIILARSPLLATVAHGEFLPDGSQTWASPTCYPSLRPPGCVVDNVLQLESTMDAPAYVRGTRSYLTTPPTCPPSGHWESVIRLWWADGSVDTVTTEQPCTPSAA
jgi:hypothetical protein